MTEEDIARIAERELQETQDEQKSQGYGSENPDIVNGGGGPGSTIAPVDPLVQPGGHGQSEANGATTSESTGSSGTSFSKSRLLMGVPVATGPNATKFLYVEVPEDSKEGHDSGKEHKITQFDVEGEASRLCGGLHDEDSEGEEFFACLSSLMVALNSR